MLAVSSLVHSLCRNNKECENSLPVRKIIAVLESKIGNCKVSKTNFDTVSLHIYIIDTFLSMLYNKSFITRITDISSIT